jgi:hypothetical protein
MFDYTMALTHALVLTRQLDVLGIEASIDITRIKKNVMSVDMRMPSIYTPVPELESEILKDIRNKYDSILVSIFTSFSSDMKSINYLFTKAQNVRISESDLNSLDYFFGELRDEVASFLKKINELKPAQWIDLVSKYLSIAFQRLATKATERLAEMGTVLRDVPTPLRIRLLWFPNTGRGVYDIPSSKIRVLNLMKQLLPDLIDYSTDENEFTRLARLALKLNDDFDIETLINIAMRLYLDTSCEDLSGLWNVRGLPKKYILLLLLNYALTKEKGMLTLIDFEGTTPITVMYPKILIKKICAEGDS